MVNLKKKENITIIIQARLNSSRLNEKVLKKINNKTVVEIIYDKLKNLKEIDKIIFAIPQDNANKKLKNYLKKKKIPFYLGSNSDVLARFYNCAYKNDSKIIIRLTADCPLVDPKLLRKFLHEFKISNVDYLSNTIFPTYPDGFDIEIFNFKSLAKAHKLGKSLEDREHVTPFIKNNPNIFKLKNITNKKNLSKIRLTLDTNNDFVFISKLFKKFKKFDVSIKDIIDLIKKDPKYFDNKEIRNFGGNKSKNKNHILKATKYIPNGNMFYSKSRKFFSENVWPTYFSKTKNIYVWDLDGKKYLDFCHMGVGTNILGYSNTYIDNKVKSVVSNGNMSSLNCSEEVDLCEKLVNMHKWSGQAKLARTGGEANSIAIRIARCNTERKKVAVCGYHGWHDWYLSANLANKNNLNNHLAKKLNTFGIPKQLKNTVYTFDYNDLSGLKKLLNNNPEIGIIKMEVQRDIKPKKNFLKEIKKICIKKKIILIFDECTSGFRETYGGLHLKYNINPDIAIFGKALGNGYAITAILGTKKIMEKSENSFLSSTFWSERIGPAAAVATLEKMKQEKSWIKITNFGKKIKKSIYFLAKKNKLKIKFTGLDSLIRFDFLSNNSEYYCRFITEEMLRSRILARNLIYVSTRHNNKNLKKYLKCLKIVFEKISSMEKQKLKLY